MAHVTFLAENNRAWVPTSKIERFSTDSDRIAKAIAKAPKSYKNLLKKATDQACEMLDFDSDARIEKLRKGSKFVDKLFIKNAILDISNSTHDSQNESESEYSTDDEDGEQRKIKKYFIRLFNTSVSRVNQVLLCQRVIGEFSRQIALFIIFF